MLVVSRTGITGENFDCSKTRLALEQWWGTLTLKLISPKTLFGGSIMRIELNHTFTSFVNQNDFPPSIIYKVVVISIQYWYPFRKIYYCLLLFFCEMLLLSGGCKKEIPKAICPRIHKSLELLFIYLYCFRVSTP